VEFVLDFGISQIIHSAKSQCGSITATHLHFSISSKIIFSKSVDFHIQVFQRIYKCLLLSLTQIQKLIFVHLKFVFQIGVKSLSGVMSSVKSGSIIGRLEGGSKALLLTQFICGVLTYEVGKCTNQESSFVDKIFSQITFLFFISSDASSHE
jgi:hypothetical protein